MPSSRSVSISRMIERLRELAGRRPEIPLVAAFGIAAGVAVAILHFASEIAEGETMAWDRTILFWLHAQMQESPALREFIRGVTALGGATALTIVVVAACAFLLIKRRYATAAFLAVQVIAGTSVIRLAKIAFARARPDVVEHYTTFANASFPSGHAANSSIVYLSVAVLVATATPRVSARIAVLSAAIVLTTAIGLSRLYLGVHWPSDVLAGWTIGGAWAIAVRFIALWGRARFARREG